MELASGRRSFGLPKYQSRDEVEKDLLSLLAENWEDIAHDRQRPTWSIRKFYFEQSLNKLKKRWILWSCCFTLGCGNTSLLWDATAIVIMCVSDRLQCHSCAPIRNPQDIRNTATALGGSISLDELFHKNCYYCIQFYTIQLNGLVGKSLQSTINKISLLNLVYLQTTLWLF